ncbi:uncharacterized protein GGS22DRAFT_167999 [Annulohypoxylon maeteangense]|uniref:uncharacterized protein n=1 Tax=Annulohypoxylon maeteangense TaxID=1927788 RepID=UPI00200738A0|nr:uncharacterized protein GGS22DRAFT_167999 [Annulohypoxylon maeteangense]KAI0883154.1 hypothetical protein GGS22DRAFT_167999 [Annulohypoxylon maeteangense]
MVLLIAQCKANTLHRYDLPPSQIAKPLPVKSQPQPQKSDAGKQGPNQTGKNLKRKRDAPKKDDAPRAFKRLMAFAGGKKPRSGLDNGDEPMGKNKKKKTATATTTPDSEVKEAKETREIPTIRPGERMSEFSARVDAALPVSGLINNSVRNGKDPLGLKVWKTKKERKMHKLYDEWREEERKIKEKKEEELELQAEKELEEEEMGVTWKLDSQGGGKRKKKGKRSKYLGEIADADEDPWEALKKKRGEAKIGLHDVVQAPPEFSVKPQKKITVGGAVVEVGGIPKAAGSLRRREELQTVRDDIVASYRKLMSEKRPSLHKS